MNLRNLTKKKAVAALALLAMLSVGYSLRDENDITQNSVMITNMAQNSGGTGIIISSTATESRVLTNSHVCRVVENGGLVTGTAGTFLAATYKHSLVHDLCLITVEGNLKANTKLADSPPQSYYEKAYISGHPALMPNVVTAGHFSGRKAIGVMVGFKKCTEDDLKDPNKAVPCLFFGFLPQVKTYDSTLVTATIMPGSSGSGVYNQHKELSGVAFAGSGPIGYAWTVPYESLKNFLNKEEKTLEAVKTNNLVTVSGNDEDKKSTGTDQVEALRKIKDVCSTPDKKKVKDICDLVGMDVLWLK